MQFVPRRGVQAEVAAGEGEEPEVKDSLWVLHPESFAESPGQRPGPRGIGLGWNGGDLDLLSVRLQSQSFRDPCRTDVQRSMA